MKKPIETKKIIVTAWILFIALFIFPPSSFGGEPIEGLVFDFRDFGGLPVELPGLGNVTVGCALVEARGRELIILTPSGRYNYYAKLEAGEIRATTTQNAAECIELIDWPHLADLVILFESATLSEHFTMEGEGGIPEDPEEVVVPDDVGLFFKVKDAMVVNPPDIEGSFGLMLKLKHGDLQFIKFKP